MKSSTCVIKIVDKDITLPGKICYSVDKKHHSIQYYENGTILNQFHFASIYTEPKLQNQFLEHYVTNGIELLKKGENCVICVLGSAESGKGYLMKGSNNSNGLISHVERQLVQCGKEVKQLSHISCVRYSNGIFYDMLSSNRSTIGASQVNGIQSFCSMKSIPLRDNKSIMTVDSTIASSMNGLYKTEIHVYSPTIWLLTMKGKNGSIVATLAIVDITLQGGKSSPALFIDSMDASSYSQFIASLRDKPAIYADSSQLSTVLERLFSSFSSILIGCTQTAPTPVSLSLLSLLDNPDDAVERTVEDASDEIEDTIDLLSSSSNSFVDSEMEREDDEEVIDSDNEGRDRLKNRISLYETPKKSAKRLIQRSMLSPKVYKCDSFSPASRSMIYKNENRLYDLMNGLPPLSPCSTLSKAKELIMKGKDNENKGCLSDALSFYEEASTILTNNDKLREKIEDVKRRISEIQPEHPDDVQEETEKGKLLQILNYSGISGLVKLATVGNKRAELIIQEREKAPFLTMQDLSRVGYTEQGIERFIERNMDCTYLCFV